LITVYGIALLESTDLTPFYVFGVSVDSLAGNSKNMKFTMLAITGAKVSRLP
jgi:hypothetical protein